MSWSVSYDSREDFEKDTRSESSTHPHTGEEVAQFNNLRIAAKHMLDAGVIGGKGRDARLSLHGHATEKHEGSESSGVHIATKVA